MGNVVDDLLKADAHNVEESKRLLEEFHPLALEAADKFAALVVAVGDSFGSSCNYHEHNIRFNDWLQTQPGSADEIVQCLEQGGFKPNGVDHASEAREDLHQARSVIARIYLILRIRRDFLFGLSDLLRFRLVPALGYLRIQSESTAILALMIQHPEMATDWLSPNSGRSFYKKYHSRVVEKMKELGLLEYYDQGSEMALHSRVQGVAPGLFSDRDAPAEDEVQLTYQEFSEPIDFFTWYGIYLKAHEQLLHGIAAGLPEVDFSGIGLAEYSKMVAAFMEQLKSLYLREKKEDLMRVLGEGT